MNARRLSNAGLFNGFLYCFPQNRLIEMVPPSDDCSRILNGKMIEKFGNLFFTHFLMMAFLMMQSKAPNPI